MWQFHVDRLGEAVGEDGRADIELANLAVVVHSKRKHQAHHQRGAAGCARLLGVDASTLAEALGSEARLRAATEPPVISAHLKAKANWRGQ